MNFIIYFFVLLFYKNNKPLECVLHPCVMPYKLLQQHAFSQNIRKREKWRDVLTWSLAPGAKVQSPRWIVQEAEHQHGTEHQHHTPCGLHRSHLSFAIFRRLSNRWTHTHTLQAYHQDAANCVTHFQTACSISDEEGKRQVWCTRTCIATVQWQRMCAENILGCFSERK